MSYVAILGFRRTAFRFEKDPRLELSLISQKSRPLRRRQFAAIRHSQLISMPMVPIRIREEIAAAQTDISTTRNAAAVYSRHDAPRVRKGKLASIVREHMNLWRTAARLQPRFRLHGSVRLLAQKRPFLRLSRIFPKPKWQA